MSEPESAALSTALGVLCDARRRLSEDLREEPTKLTQARRALERFYHGCGQVLAAVEELGGSPHTERERLMDLLFGLRRELSLYSRYVQGLKAMAGLDLLVDGFGALMTFAQGSCHSPGRGVALIASAREKIGEALSTLTEHGGEWGEGPDMGCAAWLIDPPTGGAAREAKPFPPEGF